MPKDKTDGEYSEPLYKSEDETSEDEGAEDNECDMEETVF
jgi:hypothetical protein